MTDDALIKNLPDSEVEITAEIPAETFDSYRKKAIGELGKGIELPGFRKGHVPENILVQKLGEDAILYEMAELGIAEFYPKFILEKKIEAIGRPYIVITKIAKGNPLGLKITTAVLPKLDLPDYKEIAKKENSLPEDLPAPAGANAGGQAGKVEVSDAEVKETLTTLRKNWARADFVKKGDADKKDIPESELPPLDDAFAQKLGDFKTVADLGAKIKENMAEEKKMQAKEKKRVSIMGKILEKIKIVLPKVIIENEQNKMMLQFKDNIASMGLDTGNYFKQVGKTEDEIKETWKVEAEKRVKIQFVLSKIALAENVSVPEEELSKEVAHLVEHYPGADRERAERYAEEIMRNERVWQFLEGQ